MQHVRLMLIEHRYGTSSFNMMLNIFPFQRCKSATSRITRALWYDN